MLSIPEPNPRHSPAPPGPSLESADRQPENAGSADTPAAMSAPLSSAELILAQIDSDGDRDRRNLRWALLGALAVHVVLFLVQFPNLDARPLKVQQPSQVYVVSQVRFKPPPPPTGQKATRKPMTKRIPIPDPTPDDPEPILVEEIEIPEVPFPEIDDVVFGIPGPPEGGTGSSTGGAGDGPYQVGGNVKPPVKIFDLQPRYTEEARKARIQGIVILHCVVDAEGNVTQVEVVKGLTLGLSESAIETVQQWKYKPATLEGKPVPVFYLIRVGFWMQ